MRRCLGFLSVLVLVAVGCDDDPSGVQPNTISGRFELELPDEDAVPLLFSRNGFGDMFRFDVEDEAGPINVVIIPNDQPGLVQTGQDATFETGALHGLLDSFPSGTTVHLLIFSATENLASSYPDPDSGRPIFTDLSLGSVRESFILP